MAINSDVKLNIKLKTPNEFSNKITFNTKDLKIQLTPADSNLSIIFSLGVDTNDREYIEFQGARYYKENNCD